jgi:hypothetical protein
VIADASSGSVPSLAEEETNRGPRPDVAKRDKERSVRSGYWLGDARGRLKKDDRRCTVDGVHDGQGAERRTLIERYRRCTRCQGMEAC